MAIDTVADKNQESKQKTNNSNAIGKHLVIASSLLILNNLGMIKLTSLPFIGAGLVASEHSITICIMLVSIYYCYKFWVYRKEESDFSYSRIDELAEIYINKIYFNRYKRHFENIPNRIIRYEDADFDGISINPVLEIINDKHSNYTRFDIAEFNLVRVEFDDNKRIESGLIYTHKEHYNIFMYFNVAYVLYNNNNNSSSTSSVNLHRETSYKEYKKYYKLAKILANLRLPDFIESLFPYLMFSLSIFITLIMLTINGS
ncbi:hypothetical protein NSB40_001186 [Vibrio fluvialis]|nr:hypothetical protein [Vibrio fluvialis]